MTPDILPDGRLSYVAVARSANRKIGPIPCVSRPSWSCPSDCPLRGSGCYGENRPGRPSCFDMVDRSPRRLSMAALATRKWRTVPRALRFVVVGDYLTRDGAPDLAFITGTNDLATAHPWVAWGYTHAWRRLSPRLFRYIVRASCSSAAEVAEATAAGWRCAVVDPGPEHPDTLIGSTVAGQRVVICPVVAGTRPDCESCRACGRDVPVVIAFPVHGSARKRAMAAIRKVRGDA